MAPLSRYTMLDLTHMLSGPFGTLMLTDLGMRTIKVEPPSSGEGTRRLLASDPRYTRDGFGAYFLSLNRNKESVALDLKTEEGRALFLELVSKVDVVFDNFAPGTTGRLGIDPATLRQVNPRLVTCSITGFGSDGPGSLRTAFDLVAQGMSGGMSITGRAGGEPLRSGIPIGDLASGLFAALGVIAALSQREQTGEGQHVDISMLDCQISLLNYMATMYLLSGQVPPAEGNGHFVHVPYNTFRTKTKYIIIAVLQDHAWSKLVELLGCEALRSPEYTTQAGRLGNKELIERTLEALLVEQSAEYWLQKLGDRMIPCAPVNTIADALSDSQVRHRNMVVEVPLPGGGTVSMPGNPIKLSSQQDPPNHAAPPVLGQHTDGVLRSLLGMNGERIEALRSRSIIGLSEPSEAMAS